MSRYRYVSPVTNSPCRRPLDWQSFLRWSTVGVIGLILAVGFGFAAWQQLEALRLNYETERLRRQLDELTRERQRLEIERQRKLSPLLLSGATRTHQFSLPRPDQTVRVEVRR
ncbi:MAG: hypothetical protein ACUVR8_05995 [Acidobacteriota bacterium]